ncbi:conserved hypothetical protein [Leishmania mexicana MHOM/GT/2001/U1103]|uniref:Uncharacterized protein n=1 Tax=Leishmania mexicana (strain MHOM/GT/2001/U1103) TaxID=929439 RepID=E9B363_LEIMU|nr:conserved hypothetical protein [Leishmania mexicana MHOM/GT/2001/U1103]CBZ29679.1 conserved hypothetical protein [Leishmania mexicana MHOM/GT/2001/U1103]
MDAEEYGEGEVLTGAELYLYLLRQNEEQLLRAQEKLREYATLKDTLHVLTERSRRRVLAPVAGGLAYYAAELNATNTILVLLGDGWFAERSATQAAEIAGRRVDFLRRETEVLQQEQNTLRAKQQLFMSELPEAQEAVTELLAARETGVPASRTPQPSSQEAASSSGSVIPANAPDCSGTPDAVRAAAFPHLASSGSCPDLFPSSTPPTSRAPPSSSGVPLDFSSIDVALTTFDEQDELTEDELIALEAELGDRVNDDDFVERVMTERMIAKKERRIRAELERRSGGAAAIENRSKAAEGVLVPALPPTSSSAAVPTVTAAPQSHGTAFAALATAVDNNGSSAGRREAVIYRTPGDIGGTAVRSLAAPSAPTDALPEAQAAASFSLNELASEPAPTSSLSTATLTSARPLARVALSEADVSSAASSSASAAKPSGRKEQHVRFAADVKDTSSSSSGTAVAEARRSQVMNSPGELGLCDQRISAETAPAYTPSLLRSTYTIGDIVERNEGTANGGGSGAVAGAAVVGSGVASAMPPPPLFPGQRQKRKRKSLFMRELEGDGA